MHTAIVSEQVSEQMRGLGARGNLGVNKFQEHATVERVKEQRACSRGASSETLSEYQGTHSTCCDRGVHGT